MNNYEIIVYWSTEDNAFIAEVPELAGCMADGQTHVEAVQKNEQLKTMISRQISGIDIAIDKVVYELYNLTEDEIKVVEGDE